MPWYRMPFNLHERARAAAATLGRSDPQRLVMELARDGSPTQAPVFGGELMHINFGRQRSVPRPCCACGWISERLCDWKLPSGRDCDAPLCEYCTTSPAKGKDICPVHVGPLKAWLAGRTNTTDGAG